MIMSCGCKLIPKDIPKIDLKYENPCCNKCKNKLSSIDVYALWNGLNLNLGRFLMINRSL